jgi:hypothetical protein
VTQKTWSRLFRDFRGREHLIIAPVPPHRGHNAKPKARTGSVPSLTYKPNGYRECARRISRMPWLAL